MFGHGKSAGPLGGHQAARLRVAVPCTSSSFKFPLLQYWFSASYCKLLLSARGGGAENRPASVPESRALNFWGGLIYVKIREIRAPEAIIPRKLRCIRAPEATIPRKLRNIRVSEATIPRN